MVRFWYYLRGYIILEICGAAPNWALNKLSEAKVPFWDIQWLDALTVRVKVFRTDRQQARRLAEHGMCTCKEVASSGIHLPLQRLFSRPVLMGILLFDLMCMLVLPCFIFFFQVEGNETVPETLILRELENAGVTFGIYGPNIYPKQVKDHIIQALPKLQWVTVTQRGCRAVVVVRERAEIPETQTKKGFANVVAAHGGVITGQSVYVGQAQYKVGDTVIKGDVLISGVVDLERTYLLERAHGEIFARTWREITVCIPTAYMEKQVETDQSHCIWLILGHRRIKIFGNSGISYGTCDKMINRRTMTLPKGLALPLSLEIETFTHYKMGEGKLSRKTAEEMLSGYVRSDVTRRMLAGQIQAQTYKLEEKEGLYCLEATLECQEMIARTVEAKWNNEDFVND